MQFDVWLDWMCRAGVKSQAAMEVKAGSRLLLVVMTRQETGAAA